MVEIEVEKLTSKIFKLSLFLSPILIWEELHYVY